MEKIIIREKDCVIYFNTNQSHNKIVEQDLQL